MANPTQIHVVSIPEYFQPSEQSWGAWSINHAKNIGSRTYPTVPYYYYLACRIADFFDQWINTTLGLFYTCVDLTCWTAMTVTVIPAYRVGLRNHLINLISTLVLPLLLLAHHFNYFFPVNNQRPFSLAKESVVALAILNNDQNTVASVIKSEKHFSKISLPYGGEISYLMLSVMNQNAETISYLLKQGANPNEPGVSSHKHLRIPPLCYAAMRNDLTNTKLLMKYDADPNVETPISFYDARNPKTVTLKTTILARILLIDPTRVPKYDTKLQEHEHFTLLDCNDNKAIIECLLAGGAIFNADEILSCQKEIEALVCPGLTQREENWGPLYDAERKKMTEGAKTNPYLAVQLSKSSDVSDDGYDFNRLLGKIDEINKLKESIQEKRITLLNEALTVSNIPINRDLVKMIAEYWNGNLFL